MYIYIFNYIYISTPKSLLISCLFEGGDPLLSRIWVHDLPLLYLFEPFSHRFLHDSCTTHIVSPSCMSHLMKCDESVLTSHCPILKNTPQRHPIIFVGENMGKQCVPSFSESNMEPTTRICFPKPEAPHVSSTFRFCSL